MEYSNNSDIYVFLVTLTVVCGKLLGGIQNLVKSERVMEGTTHGFQIDTGVSGSNFKNDPRYQIFMWQWLITYNQFPFELFFAISDSLKYI